MKSTTTYSIYPDNRARTGLHLLFWLLMYVFILWYNWAGFKSPFSSPANLLASAAILINIISVTYYLRQFIFPLVVKKSWALMTLSFFALLIFYAIYFYFYLKGVAYYIPKRTFFPYKQFPGIYSRTMIRLFFVLFINTMIWYYSVPIVIKIIKDSYEDTQEKLMLIQERNNTEINFLRTQIKPHFLFNALNSVYGLSIDNEKASGMVLRLSNLLRYTLYNEKTHEITLREEIALLTDYIELEKLRHKEDKAVIKYDFTKIDDYTICIKPMILQGILQYAFAHSGKEFFIRIILSERSCVLSFSIDSNNIDTPNNEDIERENVERILRMEYPEKHLLENKSGNIKLVLNLQENETTTAERH